jgi:RNA polymerase sigma-70 factor, ECF subfamily
MRRGAGISELEALYRAKLPQFVRAAAAIAGNETVGSDAVQEAFADAVRALGTFRGDSPLEAWVWRIVVNAARTARRREPLDEPFDQETAPALSRIGAHSGDDLVRAWIASLPERQRLAVFLRYFADLDYRAIATALEVEVGTVSATLSAAHTALRRAMQEEVAT